VWDVSTLGLSTSVRGLLPKMKYFLHRLTGIVDVLRLALASDSFSHECAAVLSGIRHHDSDSTTVSPHVYSLRRNIHRLEKGLLMRPRKAVFAQSYILPTVEDFAYVLTCRGDDSWDPCLANWAYDVLCEYFRFCGRDPAVDEARQRLSAINFHRDPCTRPHIPHCLGQLPPATVAYDDLLRLAQRRKSVRWFLPRPVPREAIDKAIHLAGYAPSACNRQPFEFQVLDASHDVAAVASIPMGTAGYAHNIPAIVVVVGQLRAFPNPRDRHLIYIDGSLASMAFVWALETLGVSSCCINWPEIPAREAALQRTLNLKPDERAIMLIGVGYADPDGLVAYSERKPVDLLRRYVHTCTSK
jgi:nitroreductase